MHTIYRKPADSSELFKTVYTAVCIRVNIQARSQVRKWGGSENKCGPN